MAQDKTPVQARFESEQEFLTNRLGQERTPRLAVRVALNLIQAPGHIADRLVEAAASVREQMQAAFAQHIANMDDATQGHATLLVYAEINRTPPVSQAAAVREGSAATVVSDAAVRQRRIAPEVQSALVEHCSHHAGAMQTLAARADATLDTLAALATSKDQRTRVNVAANISGRMRIEEPNLADKKAAIFSALMEGYVSDFAPHLVPVCQSSEQLREMFDKTSKALGVVEVFVDNPYTPDSVLVDIASSPTMQIAQHGVATRAKETLHSRAYVRESSSIYDDMAPS